MYVRLIYLLLGKFISYLEGKNFTEKAANVGRFINYLVSLQTI